MENRFFKALAVAVFAVMGLAGGAWAQTAIQLGTTYSGNITAEGGSQRYTFSLAQSAKLRVNISTAAYDVQERLPYNGTTIKLLNSSGGLVKTFSTPTGFPYSDSTDISTGTYQIEITGTQYAGKYDITVNAFVNEIETNNTTTNAQSLPNNGYTVRGNSTTSDVDMYKYVLTEPGRLTVNASLGSSGSGGVYDAYIRWYNSAGTQIKSSNPYTSYNDYMDLEAGTYYISVTPYNTSYTGTYTLRGNFTVAGNNETESNSTTTTAQTLTFGQTVKGFISYQDNIDMYKYVLTEPGRFTVNANLGSSSSGGVYDAYIRWYNSAGTQIKSSNPYTSYNDYMDLEAGTYYISVTPYNTSYTGTYTLRGNFTAAGNNEIEPNSNRPEADEASSLAFGQTVKGFLSYQDNIDMYRYELTQDGKLTINAALGSSGSGGVYDAYIKWYNSAGTQIKSSNPSTSYNDYMDLEAGTYYISVTPYNTSYTGTYTLKGTILYTNAATPTITVQPVGTTTPVFSENFETTNSFTIVNSTQTNKWVRGTGTRYEGSYAVYITNASSPTTSSANTYTNTASSIVHLYKDITFPASSSDFTLTFWYKGTGESTYDYMTVRHSAISSTPTAGTAFSGTQLGTNYNQNSGWTQKTITLPAATFSGQTRRLVFSWINDASQGSVPAAIDNITIANNTTITYKQNATATPLSVTANSPDGGTLSYQWFRNTTNSTSGGTSVGTARTYTPLTTPAFAGTYYYYCVVTNTNSNVSGNKTATVISNVATVIVTPTYTVTFDSRGGTSVSSRTVESGTAITRPTNPTRTGYTFAEWWTATTGGSQWNFATSTVTGNITLFARWTPITYNITYNLNDGTGATDRTYNIETATITLPIPIKAGYYFDGWYTSSSFTGTSVSSIPTGSYGNKTYYAKWSPIYTITFDANEGELSIPSTATTSIGSKLSSLPTPTRSGYHFKGWFTAAEGGTQVTPNTVFSANTPVYAQWVKIHTVTLNPNGGELNSPATIETDVNGKITLPTTDPTKDNYGFEGWFTTETEGTEITSNTVFSSDSTIYAQWEINKYTVSFNRNGGTTGTAPNIIVSHGSALSEAQKPATEPFTRTGYANDGKWYTRTGGGETTVLSETFETTNSFTLVNGSQTNKWVRGTSAKYAGSYAAYITSAASPTTSSANTYNNSTASIAHIYKDIIFPVSSSDFTLTFWFKGVGESNYDYMTVRHSATSSTPTAGTTFSGGTQIGNTRYNSVSNWTQYTITLPAATFSGQTRRLVFSWINDNYNSSSPSPAAIDNITITKEPEPYTYTEFIFGENGTPVTDNTTLYLKWIPTYTVSFDRNGGTVGTLPTSITNVVEGSTIECPLPPTTAFTRTNYVNDGKWYTSTTGTTEFICGEEGTPVTANTPLYLKWIPTYIVSFDRNGGSGTTPPSIIIPQNSTVSEEQMPSAEGITRLGYDNDRKWYARTVGTSTSTVFSETFESTNSFTLVNGSQTNKWVRGTSAKYAGSYAAYITNAASSTTSSANTYTNSSASTVHIYKDIAFPVSSSDFTLTFWFKGTGESTYDYMTVRHSTTSSTPTAGTAFSGTQIGNTRYNSVSNWTQYTITLPAATFSGQTRRLVFSWINDASQGSDPAAIDNISITKLETYTYTEFKFGENGTPVTDNTTLYLKWIASNVVTFNANGGTVSPTSSYTIADSTLASYPTPTKDGYAFEGWFTEETGGTKINENRKYSSATTIHARWSPSYVIKFEANGGTVTPVMGNTGAGGKYNILPVPTRDGYAFNGWFTEETEGEKVTENTVFSVNTTIYAQWSPIYRVTFNANGGSVIPEFDSTGIGAKLDSLPTTKKDEHVFEGWFSAALGGERITENTVFSSDSTIYAQWTPIYVIAFDAVGGNVTPEFSETGIGGKLTQSLPIPTQTGYAFEGWFTEETGGEEVTENTVFSSDSTIYAQWTPIYIITFNPTGGSTPAPGETGAGGKLGSLPASTKPNYSLTGWFTEEIGGEKVTTNTVFSSDSTIYAQWIIASPTFIFEQFTSTAPSTWTYNGASSSFARETSGGFNNSAGLTANIWSGTPVASVVIPNVALRTNGEISFKYKAINDADGLVAGNDALTYTVSVSTDNGESWANVTTGSNVSSSDFTTITSDLSAYANQAVMVQISFTRLTGDMHVKLDDVRITGARYIITFDAIGGAVTPQTGMTNYYRNLDSLPTPIKNSHTFNGWFTSETAGSRVTTSFVFNSDSTIYAQWTLYTYTVNFNLNGGSGTLPASVTGLLSGDTIPMAQKPSTEGFERDGYENDEKWYTNSTGTTEFIFGEGGTNVTGNRTLYLKWNPIEYTITYNLNGGEGVTDRTYNVTSSNIALPTPTRIGYAFEGWFSNEEFTGTRITSIPSGSTGNKEFFAKWTLIEYTITYNLDGGEGDSYETYTVNDEITLPTSSKIGYTFGGWFEDEDFTGGNIDLISVGSIGDKEFYAKWTPVEYTITYNLNGGEGATDKTYTINDLFTLPTPTKNGYTFDCWFEDEEFTGTCVTLIPSGSIGDKEFFAKWTPTNYSIYYTLNGGTNNIDNPTSYNIESEDITLEEPTRTGYAFDGWFTASNFTGMPITTIPQGSTEDKTFYAKWTPVEYTITYNLNGGLNPTNAPETYYITSTTITLPTPTRDGYKFNGWFSDEEFSGTRVTSIYSSSTGDKEFFAKWTLTNYSISYALNSGTNNIDNPTSYNIESEDITLEEPTRTGYTFDGWFTTSTFTGIPVTTIPKGSTEDKTFYAKWTPVEYTITYNLNGGEEVENETYNIASSRIYFPTPTRNGYTFGGWFSNEEFTGTRITSIPSGSTGDKEFFAKWIPINYSIYYTLNGGTNNIDNPTSYNIESEDITLEEPTRTGYAFDGWFTTSAFSDTLVTIIPQGSAEDKTFYAKWTPIEYTITYNLNGGEDVENETYNITNSYIYLPTPTRDGYTFDGWFEDEEFTGTEVTYISYGSTGDKEFFAKWTPDDDTPIFSNRVNPSILGIGVQTIGNAIQLSNLPADSKVEIYNLQGRRMNILNSGNSSILKIPVQTKGVYIAKVSFGSEAKVIRTIIR